MTEEKMIPLSLPQSKRLLLRACSMRRVTSSGRHGGTLNA